MNGLLTALVVLLVLFLLGQIRIGAQVEYCGEGLFVRVRAGAVRVQVVPAKKAKAPKKQKLKQEQPQTKKTGGLLKLALDFFPLIMNTLKRFARRLRVDELDMTLVVRAGDPADAALRYGQANALLGSLWQPITQTFRVKDGRAHVEVDFDAAQPTLYLLASLSLTVAQALTLAAVFAVRALGILIQNRASRQREQREAV